MGSIYVPLGPHTYHNIRCYGSRYLWVFLLSFLHKVSTAILVWYCERERETSDVLKNEKFLSKSAKAKDAIDSMV